MAEYVHQTLEEMIPELEEMNRIGLFTVKETKIIMKNRESYEYKLRQLTKTVPMFLNYIEYEKRLLELLKFRRKRFGQDFKKRDIEKSIADRIHKLYRLATTRFPENVSLWEQHIDFSKHLREKGYVSRLYKLVLKIHSHNQDLWVKAAQWEGSSDGNSNPELAREILLKGQRVNPESEVIILEMYNMELVLAKKIVKRKSILGIPTNQGDDETMGAETDKVAELKLAEIVYRKGVELFPANPEFHMKLLHICCTYSVARPQQEIIVNDLQRLYPDTPLVWNGLALRHLSRLNKISADQRLEAISTCLDVYRQAVERVSTEEMWSFCLRSHLRILELPDAKNVEWILKSTLSMFERALQLNTLSEDLYLDLLDLLTDLCLMEDVKQVVFKGTDQHPGSARLWLIRLRVEAGLSGHEEEEEAAEEGEGSKLEKLLRIALKKVPAEESWSLWQFVLNHLAVTGGSGLEELMERACRNVTPEVCIPAKEWCLHWTYRKGGLKALRSVYSSLKKMHPVSLDFYRLYVNIESSQVDPNLKQIRAAFEEALVEFGQTEPDLWLNYMEMERVVAKDISRSGIIQQRALNGLDSHLKESFIRKQVMLGLGR